MITGNIHAAELVSHYPKAIQTAIAYFKEHDLVNHEAGRYELDGDRMILQVIDAQTAPRAERRPEVHQQYIDVQFLAKGAERIYWFPDLGDQVVEEDLLAERDILFYQNNPNVSETAIQMQEGSYAVFFPSDVHIPAVQAEQAMAIRKIVMKIRVDSL